MRIQQKRKKLKFKRMKKFSIKFNIRYFININLGFELQFENASKQVKKSYEKFMNFGFTFRSIMNNNYFMQLKIKKKCFS